MKDETSKSIIGLAYPHYRVCNSGGCCSYRAAYRFVIRSIPVAKELLEATLLNIEPTHSSMCLYCATAACLSNSFSDPFLRSEFSAEERKVFKLFMCVAEAAELAVAVDSI